MKRTKKKYIYINTAQTTANTMVIDKKRKANEISSATPFDTSALANFYINNNVRATLEKRQKITMKKKNKEHFISVRRTSMI